jgi:hypothetical protein
LKIKHLATLLGTCAVPKVGNEFSFSNFVAPCLKDYLSENCKIMKPSPGHDKWIKWIKWINEKWTLATKKLGVLKKMEEKNWLCP